MDVLRTIKVAVYKVYFNRILVKTLQRVSIIIAWIKGIRRKVALTFNEISLGLGGVSDCTCGAGSDFTFDIILCALMNNAPAKQITPVCKLFFSWYCTCMVKNMDLSYVCGVFHSCSAGVFNNSKPVFLRFGFNVLSIIAKIQFLLSVFYSRREVQTYRPIQ